MTDLHWNLEALMEQDVVKSKGMQHVHHTYNEKLGVTRDYYINAESTGYAMYLRAQTGNEIYWFHGVMKMLHPSVAIELELHREESL